MSPQLVDHHPAPSKKTGKRMHNPVKHPIPSTKREGANIWHCPLNVSDLLEERGRQPRQSASVHNPCIDAHCGVLPSWSLPAHSKDGPPVKILNTSYHHNNEPSALFTIACMGRVFSHGADALVNKVCITARITLTLLFKTSSGKMYVSYHDLWHIW